jgi:hypothetical protein
MTIGPQTFSDFGGGVSDIFAGFGDESKAQGDFAEAEITRWPQSWPPKTRSSPRHRPRSRKRSRPAKLP